MTAASPPDSDSVDDPYANLRRRWLRSQFISGLGSAMVTLANTYIVFDRSHSVGVTALLQVCWCVPPLLLPAVASSLVNRFGGPKTFMARYVASAVIALVPVFLVITGHLDTGPLLVWCLLMSLNWGLFSPSTTVVKQMLVPRSMVSEFNADFTRNTALASVLGILLGGALLGTVGPLWIYLFNALSYVAPVFSVIPLLRNPLPAGLAHQPFHSVAGLLFGPHARHDLHAACLFTSMGFLVGGYTVTLPAIARVAGTSPNLLALLQVAAALGGLLTVRAIRFLHGRVQWGRVQRDCFVAMAIGVLVVAWANRMHSAPVLMLALSAAAIVVVGFAINLDQTILNAMVQLWTPKESQAVFFTYYALLPLVVVPVSQTLIGVLADRSSVSVALAVLGVLTLVMVAVGPHLRMRAAFDEMSNAAQPPTVNSV